MRFQDWKSWVAFSIGIFVLTTGCVNQRYVTDTKRSATEQLLLADAMAKATNQLEIPDVKGLVVAVEVISLEEGNARLLKAMVEARLLENGARLGRNPEDAQAVFMVIAGALGTVSRSVSFGIPSVPLSPGLGTPEIPFVRILKQRGYAKMRVVSYDQVKGELFHASPQVMERASFNVHSFLIFAFHNNDIYPGEAGKLAID